MVFFLDGAVASDWSYELIHAMTILVRFGADFICTNPSPNPKPTLTPTPTLTPAPTPTPTLPYPTLPYPTPTPTLPLPYPGARGLYVHQRLTMAILTMAVLTMAILTMARVHDAGTALVLWLY